MKYKLYILFFTLAYSYSCASDEKAGKEPEFRQSDRITMQVHPYENDPKNFLRLPHRSPEQDIRISIKLDVTGVKLLDIVDLNAQQDRCERYHSNNLAYMYFDKPVSPARIYTMITKPCIYQHNARFKIKVTTEDNQHLYRIQSFAVHPLSDDY